MGDKITIGFYLSSEDGGEYESKSTMEVFDSLGETEISVIGEQLNSFLRQCGYIRDNPLIFMEDVTEDEYDFLDEQLREYRAGLVLQDYVESEDCED